MGGGVQPTALRLVSLTRKLVSWLPTTSAPATPTALQPTACAMARSQPATTLTLSLLCHCGGCYPHPLLPSQPRDCVFGHGPGRHPFSSLDPDPSFPYVQPSADTYREQQVKEQLLEFLSAPMPDFLESCHHLGLENIGDEVSADA